MISNKYFLTTALLSSISMAVPAQADVTADDVLAMINSYYERLGGHLSADTSRSGNTLDVQNWTVDFQLPMGAGHVSAALNSVSLVENADGTVEIRYPEDTSLDISAKFGEEPEVNFSVDIASENQTVVASGDPDEISVTYSVDRLEITPGGEMAEIISEFFDMSGVVTGMRGNTLFVGGDIMQVTADNIIESMDFGFDGSDPSGASSSTSATYTEMVTKTSLSLPQNMSILNLSAALRDGLAGQLIATSGSTSSRTEITGGPMDMLQEITQGASTVEYTLDEGGLAMAGEADAITMNMAGIPDMPFPVSARIGTAGFNMTTPLNASDAEQDFALGLSLNDVEIDEGLWSLFDPSQALPRDPAQIELDVDGRAKTFVDLLDIMGLMMAGQSGEMPGELNSLRLKNLRLALAGADLTGSGEFTFDNSDLITFGGLPRPEGAIDLALTGANGLMDTLVAMGLLPEDQAMGARMMMGLFAVPGEGEDSLTSTIEINSEGHVLANGQRLQ